MPALAALDLRANAVAAAGALSLSPWRRAVLSTSGYLQRRPSSPAPRGRPRCRRAVLAGGHAHGALALLARREARQAAEVAVAVEHADVVRQAPELSSVIRSSCRRAGHDHPARVERVLVGHRCGSGRRPRPPVAVRSGLVLVPAARRGAASTAECRERPASSAADNMPARAPLPPVLAPVCAPRWRRWPCRCGFAGCGGEIEAEGRRARRRDHVFNERCSGLPHARLGQLLRLQAGGPARGRRAHQRAQLQRAQGRPRDDALYAIRNGGFSGAIMPANIVVERRGREGRRLPRRVLGSASAGLRPRRSPGARPQGDPRRARRGTGRARSPRVR